MRRKSRDITSLLLSLIGGLMCDVINDVIMTSLEDHMTTGIK